MFHTLVPLSLKLGLHTDAPPFSRRTPLRNVPFLNAKSYSLLTSKREGGVETKLTDFDTNNLLLFILNLINDYHWMPENNLFSFFCIQRNLICTKPFRYLF